MREFNKEDSDNICKSYEEGKTIKFLRQQYHCRDEAIINVLRKNNIPIKRKGCCVNRTLKEDYFSIIDSEEKAYFLGLLFADGNVSTDEKRSPMISISLKISDVAILEKLREQIHLTTKLRYDKREGKETAVLSVRSQIMANDLKKYNIIPNKTYLVNHLPNNIPEKFLKDFLKGLIDGDGSIYQEKVSGKYCIDFCSYHQSICEDFRQLCNSYLEVPNTCTIANYGSAYHIRFNSQNMVKDLVTILYKDSKIYIERKFKMAKQIFNNNEKDIVYSDQ